MSNMPITVARGAALLDKAAPGWEDRIDTERLDLAKCPACIVGQLYGDFYEGLDGLGIALGRASKYGFMPWGRQTFGDLTGWWRYLLHQRRAA